MAVVCETTVLNWYMFSVHLIFPYPYGKRLQNAEVFFVGSLKAILMLIIILSDRFELVQFIT